MNFICCHVSFRTSSIFEATRSLLSTVLNPGAPFFTYKADELCLYEKRRQNRRKCLVVIIALLAFQTLVLPLSVWEQFFVSRGC